MTERATIAAAILHEARRRGPGKSLCPSEVARALAAAEPAWRALMGPVRAVAIELARDGAIEVLRKGRPVDPAAGIRGVIRLRLARPPQEE